MSSAQVDRSSKMGHITKKENEKSRKTFNPSHKKHKHEDSRHFKFGRKRLQSFTSNGKFFPPYKRRKKEGVIIPPTKFLLGGNICDPLNLNSMQDEEINRAMNAVTPKSSPLPTPKHKKEVIEVIIPPNICDPLNLNNCNDNDNDEYEKQLISPTKKGSKRRNRKKKRASSGSGKDDVSESAETTSKEADTIDVTEPMEQGVSESMETEQQQAPLNSPPPNQPKESKPESPQKDKNKLRLKGLEEPKDKRLRKVDTKDKIVSPVIPQPGAWKSRPQHRPSQDKKKKQTMPNFREKDAHYQYGNYNRYYGYRNSYHEVDTRLTIFAQRKYLFVGKDVLDIGCNIGHITLSVARDFSAKSVTGIDIDRTLINIARKNIKHYVNCVQSPARNENNDHQDVNFFPISMPINYGPVDIPGFTKNKSHKGFPYNVTFVQGNYVLEDDTLLCTEQPQFHTILCLSLTKWIHLNFGDAGLKQAFKRMYAQLRPGGVLILEPQGWSSYTKKKNLTERIYKNYRSIEFRPHNFTQYLLSPEVGFSKCEVLSIPPHPSKGFQRPIQLFTKAGPFQESPDNSILNSSKRQDRIDEKTREFERKEYEKELFKKEEVKQGNLSEISQQSNESMSQYDQLENVYAPSSTPCYDDTPGHNSDNQPPDASKMCYLDVNMENDKTEVENQLESNVTTATTVSEIARQSNESSTENHTSRKRNIDVAVDNTCTVGVKRSKVQDETSDVKDNQRTVEIQNDKTSRGSVSINISESKSDHESNIQSVNDETSSIHLKENKDINGEVQTAKDCTENGEDSRTAEGHEENGSRSPCIKEQTETQHCELIPDNT
uniref:7SK snRNA methylphosphate capping enzyme-like n=1 Tax=Osmia lignaria TaxID=473952 RepID=UPI00147972E4|nr:7SK snRNA methylphosphate capping enzyme-like [Osmia lignaria]XP_034176105.1 7SK snRNA methylphosphate capping enzyme-like [Osmia lignaria]XP_034176106.1 7SK snRNA methylphosphate capping enzyme-like [Osmia lignaria]XP_034176107.1 7SK snRNA methylphosphate capping enzyme-like [Osmia lignaria]